jgi:hypothetical protein
MHCEPPSSGIRTQVIARRIQRASCLVLARKEIVSGSTISTIVREKFVSSRAQLCRIGPKGIDDEMIYRVESNLMVPSLFSVLSWIGQCVSPKWEVRSSEGLYTH